MNKFESASIIAGLFPNSEEQATAPTNVHMITGESIGKSEDGKALINMDGVVFSGDDSQYVEVNALGGLEDGDTAAILLSGESGRAMAPFAIGSIGSVDRVRDLSENAMVLAEEADAVAQATGQYFWHNTGEEEDPIEADVDGGTGAHVTQFKREEWSNPESENYHSGPNSLWNSLGMLFRNGLNNLLAFVTGTKPGMAIYDGFGNNANNILASFSADGVRIGRDGARRLIVTDGSLLGVNDAGAPYLSISDSKAETTQSAFRTLEPLQNNKEFAVDGRVQIGDDSSSLASILSNSEGYFDLHGVWSDSPGTSVIHLKITGKTPFNAREGDYEYAEVGTDEVFFYFPYAGRLDFQQGVEASRTLSGTIIFEDGTTATVESIFTYNPSLELVSSGVYISGDSFSVTTMNGVEATVHYQANIYAPSYVFGSGRALGAYSMAIGDGTSCLGGYSQVAVGAYNIEDTLAKYAFIVGNGTAGDARSNAFTVDRSGNLWAAGKAALTGAIEAASAAITGAITAASATITGALSAASATISGALSFGGSLTVGSETFTTQQIIDVLTKALPVQLFKGTYSETYNKSVTLSESVDNFSRICIEWRTSDGANGSTMLDMDVATVTDAATGRTGRVAAAVAINNNVGATSAYIKSKLFFVSGSTISNWTRTISSSTVYQRSEATVKNNAATTITNNELIGITKVLGWR